MWHPDHSNNFLFTSLPGNLLIPDPADDGGPKVSSPIRYNAIPYEWFLRDYLVPEDIQTPCDGVAVFWIPGSALEPHYLEQLDELCAQICANFSYRIETGRIGVTLIGPQSSAELKAIYSEAIGRIPGLTIPNRESVVHPDGAPPPEPAPAVPGAPAAAAWTSPDKHSTRFASQFFTVEKRLPEIEYQYASGPPFKMLHQVEIVAPAATTEPEVILHWLRKTS